MALHRGHDRTVRARKNVLASLGIKGCNILIGLLLVPLTIHYVNPHQYGIWLTLSSIIGWFAFFDVGFGNGLRNKFAEALSSDDHALARIYLSTTYAILAIIVAGLLVVFSLVNPWLDWPAILNAPVAMGDELRGLAWIVFATFCLQFVLQLLTSIVTAMQQPAKAALFALYGSVLSLLAIYALTRSTAGNLQLLALALGLSPVLVLLVASVVQYRGNCAAYAPAVRFVRFGMAAGLASLGLKFFVIQVAAVLMYQTSNLIIAQLFGPDEVTAYNVAFRYFGLIPMVMSIVVTPFWSAFTEAWVRHDLDWIQAVMRKLRRLWLAAAVVTLAMVPLAPHAYRVWVGEAIEIPWALSISLALYVIINAWNAIYSQFLNGTGKIGLQLYLALGGSLVNVPLAIHLGESLGMAGVVLSSVLVSVVSAVVAPIQYRKIVSKTARGLWAR